MACTSDGLIRGTHQYGWIFVPEWILPGEWSGPGCTQGCDVVPSDPRVLQVAYSSIMFLQVAMVPARGRLCWIGHIEDALQVQRLCGSSEASESLNDRPSGLST